jgi:hypothetical protein
MIVIPWRFSYNPYLTFTFARPLPICRQIPLAGILLHPRLLAQINLNGTLLKHPSLSQMLQPSGRVGSAHLLPRMLLIFKSIMPLHHHPTILFISFVSHINQTRTDVIRFLFISE